MITVVCGVTNETIFTRALKRSLEWQNVPYKFIREDITISAPEARNRLLPRLYTKYVMFVHQDVRMLSSTWLESAERWCDKIGDDLGMAGVAGKSWGGKMTGFIVHCFIPKARTRYFGKLYPAIPYGYGRFTKPQKTMTLDGQVQIIPLEVFKQVQYDEEITQECAVDYCLAVRWELGKHAWALPLPTWHAKGDEGRIGKAHGYVSPFHQGGNLKKANTIIRKKWKGMFNLIFSTTDIHRCPVCKWAPCTCNVPFTENKTLGWQKFTLEERLLIGTRCRLNHHDYSKIRIAIVGTGAMGRGIAQVIQKNDDMRVIGIADINSEALEKTKPFVPDAKVTTNPYELIDMKPDILIDATTAIVDSVRFNKQALDKRINVILMNAEVDQMYGRLLARYAEKRGVILSSDAGDQYGVLIREAEAIKSMGFEIVMCGNNKGYLDRYANPTIQKPFCEKLRLNLKPCTAYTDGTKLAIEMALIANALDLKLLKKGMIGPKARHVKNALKLFDLDQARKLGGVVDYVLGAKPSGSVFTIAYSDDVENRFYMKYYKMGKGPYYVFLRPYHLCHFETPYAIRKIMIDKKPVLVQKKKVLEVGSYAKIELKAGTVLDGIGGYHLYGLLEDPNENSLPIALSDGVVLKVDKKKDEAITWSDVDFPIDDARPTLWAEQELW